MSSRDIVQAAAGVGGEQLYVDDVFSTYIYDGNGSTQTITNGIDLAGKGGMVWVKRRSSTQNHLLVDTARGVNSYLAITTAAATASSNAVSAFNSNGFTADVLATSASDIYTSWTFRNAPKFFTHTTVSHTNGVATNIDLTSLGEVGMVVAKITNTTGDWITWHRSLTSGNNLRLNTTAAQSTTNAWLSVSGTTATLSSAAPTGTYVIYAWAHDTSSEGMIKCGSLSSGSTVNLGWEPQFLLTKRGWNSGSGDWPILDSVRGLGVDTFSTSLYAQGTNVESGGGAYLLTSTGFKNNGASSIIYLAIRMPNKPPTSGTEVFQPVVYTGTNVDNRLVDTGIKTDMVWLRERNDTTPTGFVVGDRLRGQPYLWTGASSAELSDTDSLDQQIVSTVEYGTAFSSMTGVWVGNDGTAKLNIDTTSNNYIALAFKRAPGFFDVVCYTGTGAVRTVDHNLGVAPELAIIKQRNAAGLNWVVFPYNLGDYYLSLNTTNALSGPNALITSTPSATNISLGTSSNINGSGSTYVAYLFATLPGISKVGSYTGNGSTQTINCGFSAGARFVLIKRTDSTGDWYVWDTARGIVAGNDPHLSLNSTAAEVTTNDSVDTDSSGFIVNQLTATNINVTSATYIFLAIA